MLWVKALLWAIWVLTARPAQPMQWPAWPTVFGGIGLLFQAFATYSGGNWGRLAERADERLAGRRQGRPVPGVFCGR